MIYSAFFLLFMPFISIGEDTPTPSAEPQSVRIGTQQWMAENLAVTQFRNGDAIPRIEDPDAWATAGASGKPAQTIYDNAATPKPGWGLLYNYAAIADPRGICPVGWRIPSKADWKTLEQTLGAEPGKKLRAKQGWGATGRGTDGVGFRALPAGFRTQSGQDFLGDRVAYFWPADAESNGTVIAHMLFDYDTIIFRIEYEKAMGMSVRCMKGAPKS
jgi:uncharacterized protein (TIGR02145 family)